MNDNAIYDDAPDLSDDDIELLHAICKAASASHHRPQKALFASYTALLAEKGAQPRLDGTVLHTLLRVGKAASSRGRDDGRLDLVGCLKEILEEQGITLLENDVSESGDLTTHSDGGHVHTAQRRRPSIDHAHGTGAKHRAARRRVSFDDARLDETWLREHTDSIHMSSPLGNGRNGLLAQPARRGRNIDDAIPRRARSTSIQHKSFTRQPERKVQHHATSSSVYTSDLDDHTNPALLLQPSQTQLEMNAEAFAATLDIRTARRCLRTWCDAMLLADEPRRQALAIASSFDRRTLLKQAWDAWLGRFQIIQEERQEQHRVATVLKRNAQDFERQRDTRIMRIAFRHWALSASDQQIVIAYAKKLLLRKKYFERWRQIATDNAWKVKRILTRKWMSVWREKVVRRQLREEQAQSVHEESMIRRCWDTWFWSFCSRRVDARYEDRVKAQALYAIKDRIRSGRNLKSLAETCRKTLLARGAIQQLQLRLEEHQCHDNIAIESHQRNLIRHFLVTIKASAKLAPIASTIELKFKLDLQRKVFRTWSSQAKLLRQAAEVDRKRALQSAWTSWNDALRTKALGLKIDERVVVESLYKWVLASRSKLLERTVNERMVRQAFQQWRHRLHEGVSKLDTAEAAFRQGQRRRALASGMVSIHLALRQREDADRAAVEFANARLLPRMLLLLVDKHHEIKQLEHWAVDARFYSLCTRTLSVWRERTTQQAHNKRRDAYARVRARVKIRLVGSCFAALRRRCADSQEMATEAERRTQERLSTVGTQAFLRWRERNSKLAALEQQASSVDRQKLLLAALAAVKARGAELTELTQRAGSARQEWDLALLSSALKKLQWEQFTAARRNESADALWVRTRDQHIRQMVRHWSAQTVSRRKASATAMNEEPESPSLRPASRAASRSRSVQGFSTTSPPATIPAYMRTPSRSRRGGRFRPLPTPAPVTPFAFDASYLATTPTPLPPPFMGLEADETVVDTSADAAANDTGVDTLTPQVTPFARKLRAGGFASTPAPSILRTSVLGRSAMQNGPGGTAKSVRFARASRFQRSVEHEKSS